MEPKYISDRIIEPKEVFPNIYAIAYVINVGPNQVFDVVLLKAYSLDQALEDADAEMIRRNYQFSGIVWKRQAVSSLDELFPGQLKDSPPAEPEPPVSDQSLLMQIIIDNNDIPLFVENQDKFSFAEKQYLRSKLHL